MAEQKQQKKEFDIALCIDDKEQYKTVLCGPLTYEYNSRNLEFAQSQRYIKGDINKVNESSNFVQEIDTERYINAFHMNSKDVTGSDIFCGVVKLQLFIFKNASIWNKYVASQRKAASDLVLIVNNANKPIYVLHGAVTSIVNKSISMSSFNEYQGGDIKILDEFGVKTKTFAVNNEWRIKMDGIGIETKSTFKNGLCYKFADDDSRNRLLLQSYDVALVTDAKNQIEVLLSDITYIYKDNAISFASCIPYKNGFYQKLKEFGEQKKAFKPKEYREKGKGNATYQFETQFEENKCLLFDIKRIEEWIDFIEAQTNTEYDAAVISNSDDYQVLFLNKIQINLMEKVILFAESESFTPKHHGLINKFGKLMKKLPFDAFSINIKQNSNKRKKLSNIFFYKWDMKKEVELQTETETETTIAKKENKKSPKKSKKTAKRDSLIKPSALKKMKRAKSAQTLPKKGKKNTKNNKKNKKKTENENMNKTRSYENGTKSRSSKKKEKQNSNKSRLDKVVMNGKVIKMKKSKSYMAVGHNVNTKPKMNGSEQWDKEKKKEKKMKIVVNGTKKEKDKVWQLYIKRYGSKPKNATQLQDFAKKNKKTKPLSYKEAKALFRDRSK